jgi:deoxyribodipyrimidine photo-lyase
MSTAIVWFRRDLRLHDHPALTAARRAHERVVPAFVLDPLLLHGRFASAPRTAFMLGCLDALDTALRERGSRLVWRTGIPEHVLPELAAETGASTVLWTSDVSPYARGRDRRVSEALRSAGVRAEPHGGNYVIDVSRPRTGAGEPYSVFSPFHRSWAQAPRREVHRAPRELAPLPDGLDAGRSPEGLRALGLRAALGYAEPVVAPGEAAAREAARRWLAGGLDGYAAGQDDVGADATSILSPYLRWGCLSALELAERAERHGGAGADAWVRQLAWRDFYAHVLHAWPQNTRLEFQARRRGMAWADPARHLASWQRGETGYPLVDAGMRQLAATGWMHNRVRLAVGSFLTKDLHLDWREGERWFEHRLLDGEPAQNNGNWQWIASVGTDPAPVFRRLYNPTRQAERFDPDGTYIRRWVPELRAVPSDRLAEPWRMSEADQRTCGCVIGRDYPAPIVDHGHERRRALARYAAGRQTASSERT